jgi:hypothetical protein
MAVSQSADPKQLEARLLKTLHEIIAMLLIERADNAARRSQDHIPAHRRRLH